MIRELLGGLVAIAAATIGLLIIAVMNQVAIESADAWWQWIIGFAISGALSLLALAVIFMAMSYTVGSMAAGWAGMVTGRLPHGYSKSDGNLGRGFGNLALFALAVAAGLALYRAGVAGGNLNWAVEGLLLVGAGVAIGLLQAIPRFYFAARAAGRPVGKKRSKRKGLNRGDEGASSALLATVALLSIALSMCTADLVHAIRTRDGEATLPYGDWVDGCVDAAPSLDDCAAKASLTLIPRHRTRLRIEHVGSCSVRILTADGEPAPLVPLAEMKRRGVEPGGGASERTRRMLDPGPGDRYRIEVEPGQRGACFYGVRYLDEPTGRAEATP